MKNFRVLGSLLLRVGCVLTPVNLPWSGHVILPNLVAMLQLHCRSKIVSWGPLAFPDLWGP